MAGRTREVSGIPGRAAGPAQGREQSAEETRGAGAPRTERREGVAEAAAPPRGPGARVRACAAEGAGRPTETPGARPAAHVTGT